MSIDYYYKKIDSRWVCLNVRGTNESSENIPHGDISSFLTDFWVDICHGGNYLIDERYYFEDLASALEFYQEGWREFEFVGDDGKGVGLSHSGLYSQGRLVHGLSTYGDAPGHEGETLRRICEDLKRDLHEQG